MRYLLTGALEWDFWGGDRGTGKTCISQGLFGFARVGDRVSGLTASRTGIAQKYVKEVVEATVALMTVPQNLFLRAAALRTISS